MEPTLAADIGANVKAKVAEKGWREPERLRFAGENLEDSQTLEDYNIRNGDQIVWPRSEADKVAENHRNRKSYAAEIFKTQGRSVRRKLDDVGKKVIVDDGANSYMHAAGGRTPLNKFLDSNSTQRRNVLDHYCALGLATSLQSLLKQAL